MKAQIEITEASEQKLNKIKAVAAINELELKNKEKLINFAIKIAYDCIVNLDEESLINVTGLKKSI